MPANDPHILLSRLQEREREFAQVQSLAFVLAPVKTVSELEAAVPQLKSSLGFDGFYLLAEKTEKTVEVIASYAIGKISKPEFGPNHAFEKVSASPEPELLQIASQQANSGILSNSSVKYRSVFALPLRCPHRGVTAYFLYKDVSGPERSVVRMFRFLESQWSVTACNLLSATSISQLPVQTETSEAFHTVDFGQIIGSGKAMTEVKRLIAIVAQADTGVLVTGESGTGKEGVAAAIHQRSSRKNRLYVRVNCAAIPPNLLESELFGHEKGSFTGALQNKKGKFELAHKGTLFLDEIGELPIELQGKLLRALQEGEISRIGASNPIKVDVRIVAATNRDLLSEVKAGRFRADLYYRLNIFPIRLPSLRDKIEDIAELSGFFLQKACLDNNRKPMAFSAETLRSMQLYSWPGNARELQNLINRAVLLTPGNTIIGLDYPSAMQSQSVVPNLNLKTLAQIEKEHILAVLAKCGNRISGPNGAAKILGLPSTTLISRMQKLGIKKQVTDNSER